MTSRSRCCYGRAAPRGSNAEMAVTHRATVLRLTLAERREPRMLRLSATAADPTDCPATNVSGPG
jgi:hypothetical protein